MKYFISAFYLLFLGVVAVMAEDAVRPIPLVLHPTSAPSPALKYPLLPELRDAIPGNAADHYRQAVKNTNLDASPQSDWRLKIDKWLAVPLKDLPREEVGKFLKQYDTMFQEIEAGARSEDCDWGLTERLRKTGISTRFPDGQKMRAVAYLLQLRIRLELAEGGAVNAVGTLRTGFALARHTAEAPTLMAGLVGLHVADLMESGLEELIQQPDAPNLYWSLTDLPRPFIDLRKPMQGERVMAYGCFPGMAEMQADLNAKPLTQEQLLKTLTTTVGSETPTISPPPSMARTAEAVSVMLRELARHEVAKKLLIAQGRPKELVDAMPYLQLDMLDAFLQYDRLFDDSAKCLSLPYWEALPEMKKADERMKKALKDKNGPFLPIGRLLLPAVEKVAVRRATNDRRIAALRCVEAVRFYAAAHDGKLPVSLEDIKETPAPIDPVTGKAFDYHITGDHAFLTCKPLPGQPPSNTNTPSYELSIQR